MRYYGVALSAGLWRLTGLAPAACPYALPGRFGLPLLLCFDAFLDFHTLLIQPCPNGSAHRLSLGNTVTPSEFPQRRDHLGFEFERGAHEGRHRPQYSDAKLCLSKVLGRCVQALNEVWGFVACLAISIEGGWCDEVWRCSYSTEAGNLNLPLRTRMGR